MKRGVKTLICALGALALTTGARAVVDDSGTAPAATETGDSPYSAIWLRNVFDLKAPAPAIIPPETNAPPPNVTLTGITTLLGSKRALFLVQDAPIPGKPPTKEQSFILSEGQRQGVLEVLEINPAAGTVKIKNEEIISTITFATNKTSGGLGGGPPTMPGGMPHQPRFNQPPGINPNFNSTPLPTRMMRGGDASQSAPPGAYQTGYGMATGGGGTAAAPPPPNAPASNPAPTPGNAPQETVTVPPQVTAAMLALQAANVGSKGLPAPPSAPPTSENVPDLQPGLITPPTDQGNGVPSPKGLSAPPPIPKYAAPKFSGSLTP